MNEVVIEKSNPCIWKVTWETKYFMNKTVVMDIATNLYCVCVVIFFLFYIYYALQPSTAAKLYNVFNQTEYFLSFIYQSIEFNKTQHFHNILRKMIS